MEVQPEHNEEVRALLGTAGFKTLWTGFSWLVSRDSVAPTHVSKNVTTLDQWRAVLAVLVEKHPG